MPTTKTTSMYYPWRRNVTTSMVGLQKNKKYIKNGHIHISPKLVNPRDIAGNVEVEEEEPQPSVFQSRHLNHQAIKAMSVIQPGCPYPVV